MAELNYNISTIKSSYVSDFNIDFFNIKTRIKEIFNEDTAYILLKESNEVSVGLYKNKDFIFKNEVLQNKDLFIDMRIFNNEKELYIWKSKYDFKNRIRIDNEGKEYDFYDEELLLWGNKIKNDGIFMELEEEKIKKYYIPINENVTNDNEGKLVVRNYIGCSGEDGMAIIEDFRLLDIKL